MVFIITPKGEITQLPQLLRPLRLAEAHQHEILADEQGTLDQHTVGCQKPQHLLLIIYYAFSQSGALRPWTPETRPMATKSMTMDEPP